MTEQNEPKTEISLTNLKVLIMNSVIVEVLEEQRGEILRRAKEKLAQHGVIVSEKELESVK